MKKVITLILTCILVFSSTIVFGHKQEELIVLDKDSIYLEEGILIQILSKSDIDLSSKIVVSRDPIHPYIHELMKDPDGNIVITDSVGNNITHELYKMLVPFYESGNNAEILKIIDSIEISMSNSLKLDDINNLSSIGVVQFYYEESLAKSPYYDDASFTITNDIFVSNDRFSGYTTPKWKLYPSEEPLTLNYYECDPSIINSGYTYKVYLEFLLRKYQVIIPRYKNTLYYHYI